MRYYEKYLNLILCVCFADSIVTESERLLFLKILDDLAVPKELRDKYEDIIKMKTFFDSEQLLQIAATGTTKEELAIMVKDAYMMASVDEEISEVEINTIKKFLEYAKIPRDKHSEIIEWAAEGLDHLKRGFKLFGMI